MQIADYQAYSEALLRSVTAMPQVIGLVAMGSMAATRRQPDIYSDHDFWVVTTDGQAEALRQSCAWLPPYREVVLCYKETEHGVKVVYDDGHLIEYAVFTLDELRVTRANDYRVLLDRGGVSDEIIASAERTHTESAQQPNALFLYQETLTRCLVGALRWGRGEKISGHRFVKNHALDGVLRLLALRPTDAPVDNIDPFRRVELAYPDEAARIHDALLTDTPDCALTLIEIAGEALKAAGEDVPVLAQATIRRKINALKTNGDG